MRTCPGLAETAVSNGEPLSAAIYDRVSKDPTGTYRSVEKQEGANRRVCDVKGWRYGDDDIYTDNDRSASRFATKERPDWKRLWAAVADRRYHVVVLWEVSRGDRDDLLWLTFLHLCRRLGVWIHIESHQHTYDPRKRRDYKTLAEEGLDSADESERIAERIRGDVKENARKGRPHGRTPYGYRREYEIDARGRRHITGQYPDETARTATAVDGLEVTYTPAGIIREIVRRLLAGETCLGAAADLNRRGIPNPRGTARGWLDSTVRGLALNPTYAGYRVLRRSVFADGIWPALISRSDHHTLVARMADPERRTQRNSIIKHLGSGLFVCGVCGKVVRSIKREYGRAYICTPTKVVAKSEREKRRAVTDAELGMLVGLGRREQTATILDLYRAGVTQASIARGLGIRRSTLSLRLATECRRRGVPVPPRKPPSADVTDESVGYHVTRNMEHVDKFVQRAIWLRLARPDISELLAEDSRADERLAELSTAIAEKQARLDQARDSYATGAGLSLDSLLRIQSQLEPEIKQARARLDEARIGPVLDGLILPSLDEIRAEWRRRDLPQRREVIRALTERVEIMPIGGGRRQVPIEESVRIMWRQPR